MIDRCLKKLAAWLSAALLAAALAAMLALPVAAEGEKTHPTILFLSSYAYDWDSVPDQLAGVASVMRTAAKMDYVFMDT